MKRNHYLAARDDYLNTLARRGFILNPDDPYWQENSAYEFSLAQIDVLDDAATELHQLCLKAIDHIIERDYFHHFGIRDEWKNFIIRSWQRQDPDLYGRFDFAYDGQQAPKLLEYNADTPTGLLEAAVLQWDWLKERQLPDQFNFIHEQLIKRWQQLKQDRRIQQPVYFSADHDSGEDTVTTEYLRDTCEQAGLETATIKIEDIGWNGEVFTDLEEYVIPALFKLYPWEFIAADDFGANVLQDKTQFIEPVWKMLLSNKALLPILWELAPNHPNLLEAHFDKNVFNGRSHVQKAKLGREGASIQIHHPDHAEQSSGVYGEEGYVYQAYHAIPEYDGQYPVCGIWVVDGVSCGLGIREDKTRITRNTSNFVPHFFVE